jgi:hypothetical protein
MALKGVHLKLLISFAVVLVVTCSLVTAIAFAIVYYLLIRFSRNKKIIEVGTTLKLII